MTLQEILKAKGLSDEDIESVIGEMKQNKIFTTSHENMDVRYPKLKADHETLTAEHGESAKLIEQFKAGAKDNEALQGKITNYEATISKLQEEKAAIMLENAIKIAVMKAKAIDVDYITFKLKEKGDLELDENGNVKGIDDKIAGLKTELPAQFEAEGKKGREIDPQPLPKSDDRDNEPQTLAEAIKQNYTQAK